MDTPSWEPSVVLRRLDRLEAQNRFWRKGALAVLAVTATSLLVAANYDPSPQDLVVAKRFRLQDDQGRSRAELFMSNLQQPALVLYDEKGKERATMRLTKEGPQFWLWDEQGKGRATFRLEKSTPELVYFKKGSEENFMRLAANDQNGFLGIWNAEGQYCFHADDQGTVVRQGLQVNDQQDKSRISLKSADDGPQFWLWDDHNRGRMLLQLSKNAPELAMFDEQKKRLFAEINSAGPQLGCLNKNGNHFAARIGAAEHGGGIGVWNAEDQACFAVDENATVVRQVLQVNDINGNPRIQLAKTANTNALFKMLGDNGSQRLLMFVGEKGEGGTSCTFFDENGRQQLLNIGAANGKSGFITGFNPSNTQVFWMNKDGSAAKNFQRIQ